MRNAFHRMIDAWQRKKLLANPGVSIGDGCRISYRRIQLKGNANCKLTIGNHSWIDSSLVFEKSAASLRIGENTFIIGATISCANQVIFGNNVQVAWGVNILDHNSHSLNYIERRSDLPNTFNGIKTWVDVSIGKVFIDDDAWLGVGCIILKNVHIGKGAIVAAGSVVTKDVPPFTVVAGNPAVIIKQLKKEE